MDGVSLPAGTLTSKRGVTEENPEIFSVVFDFDVNIFVFQTTLHHLLTWQIHGMLTSTRFACLA
jgi:hypothetical protein